MIGYHPIYGHHYSYHIRGDRSPLNMLNGNYRAITFSALYSTLWQMLVLICLDIFVVQYSILRLNNVSRAYSSYIGMQVNMVAT